MQRGTRKRLLSTKTQEPGNFNSSKLISPPDTPLCKLYRHISDCPLDLFIEAKCDENLRALILEGYCPPDDLQKIWEGMWNEFIDKMQDGDGVAIRQQAQELNLIRTRINSVLTIVQFIEYLLTSRLEVDLDLLLAELSEWCGMDIRLNQKDKAACVRMLEMVIAHTKRWWMDAEGIRREMEQATADQDGHEGLTRTYFDEMLVALSIANKFKVNRQETTVAEFCIMVQALRRQIAEARDFSKN